MAPVPDDLPPPRARRGLPVLGVLIALVFSGGLVWWLTAPETPVNNPPAVVRPAPAPAPKAPPAADPAQVQQAFEAVQDAYADGGADGLTRANADCAAALRSDPRVLDYCLAFDLFATAVAPEIARSHPETARLEAARAALPPGVDPAARIATVRTLMRMQSLGEAQKAPAPPGPPVRLTRAASHSKAHAMPREMADDRRREAARAAVRALFARAEAASDAASRAAPAAPPASAEEAPH